MDQAVSRSLPVVPGHVAPRQLKQAAAAQQVGRDDQQLLCNQLLIATADGDRGSFRRLYAQTSAQLFAVIRRTVWHGGEAEDVLQEVYLKIWRHASAFDPAQSQALTWMSRIARNHAIDHLRRQAARPVAASEWVRADDGETVEDLSIDTAPRPDEWLELQQQRHRVDRLLASLSGVQRQVLLMAFQEGRSQSDIALHLGTPLGSVKSWMRRALQQLKLVIDREDMEHHGSNA